METDHSLENQNAPELPLFRANRLLLSIHRESLQVPTFANAEPIELGGPELLVLAAFDRPEGGSRTEVLDAAVSAAGAGPEGRARLEQFFDRLVTSGWITSEPSEVSSRTPAEPASQVGGNTAPPVLADTAAISTPRSVRPVPNGYEFVSHLGDRIATVSWQELLALQELVEPITLREAIGRHRDGLGALALDEGDFLAAIGRLAQVGIVSVGQAEELEGFSRIRAEVVDESLTARDQVCQEVFTRFADADDAEERAREARTGVVRPQVVPVAFDPVPPLALALITAYGKVFDGGRLGQHYNFRREWVWLEDRFEQHTSRPAIYMFSNYLWSHAQCIEISRRVKAASPASITMHGGPDTPKYEADARGVLRREPARRHHGPR